MDEILKIETVHQYNTLMGVETLHPLISVIDLSSCKPMYHLRANYGFYALFLKDVKCGDIRYGRNLYDYQAGSMVCMAPGQLLEILNNHEIYQPQGWALVFHPDLIKGTSLGHTMKNYSFFSYEATEALHLSDNEREVMVDCLKKIGLELNHAIDKHTNKLIATNIELLLDYCERFYDRQFITRNNVNKDILVRFERLLDDYFQSDEVRNAGFPTVRYCADKLNLSANYFGDLIKKETGKSPQEQIQFKLIDIAKERIFDPTKTITEISYELGFKYPQHFTRLFKTQVGCSPNEYRIKN